MFCIVPITLILNYINSSVQYCLNVQGHTFVFICYSIDLGQIGELPCHCWYYCYLAFKHFDLY